MTKPVPLDLARFAGQLDGGREFLRAWIVPGGAVPGGAVAGFVNPVPVGPDPADFGAALADCARHAAAAYARAVRIPEAEAMARLRAGLDAELARAPAGQNASGPAPSDDPVTYLPPEDPTP